jgi:outer membrane lipoprotein-sorting protein
MTTAFRLPDCPPAIRRRVLILAALGTVAACTASTPPLALNDTESREVAQIGHYLDGLRSFQASFTQSGAFGDGAGTVLLDRPGHLRIEYAGSPGKTLVANNGRVVVYDGATGGTTTTPVSRTPLGMLLSSSITLTGPVTVTAYRHEPAFSELTIKKTDAPGDGSLTLFFSPPPLALTAVMLTDGYDRPLLMRLSNMRLNPPLTPDLFQYPGLRPGT